MISARSSFAVKAQVFSRVAPQFLLRQDCGLDRLISSLFNIDLGNAGVGADAAVLRVEEARGVVERDGAVDDQFKIQFIQTRSTSQIQ